jgi:hypothetical protein
MARCYVKHDDEIVDVTGNDPYDNLPCSNATGVQTCCANNSECTKDGFCYFTHQQSAAVTGYYLGGCTDPNFEAAACPQHCTGLPTQDVVYNTTSGLWACCYGSGDLNCNDPSDETFYAPNPRAILATSSVATSATSTTTTTPSAAPHTTSNTSSTPSSAGSSSHSHHNSDSTTTIVVATVIPVVFIVAAVCVFFWFLRRKSWQQREAQSPHVHSAGFGSAWQSGRHEAAYYKSQPGQGPRVHELPGDEHRVELNATSRRSELRGT